MIMDSNTRYSKQMKVSYIGEQGQQKLSSSHVAIVGLGALGSIVAEQLTRAGVGTLTLIDRDYVELSNLQRQQLYTEQDVKSHIPKAIAAYNRLTQINSTLNIIPIVTHLSASNIDLYLQEAELIIDATDNLAVRYLINEYAVREQKVWIYGAVASTYGRMLVINPEATPCFRCIYPASPELDGIDTCDTVGVLSSIVNIVGSLQATEALKWLIAAHDYVSTQLIEFDIWTHQLMKIDVQHAKHPQCPVCVQNQFNLLDKHSEDERSSLLCGRNTVQVYYHKLNKQNFEQYVKRFRDKYETMCNKYLCKINVKDYSITIFPDGRCLVQGTENIVEAESVIFTIFDY